jgi:hypothetical protein
MLLVVRCQPRADPEGLVWQPLFPNVDCGLEHRDLLYAVGDYYHPIGSSQGAVLRLCHSKHE